MIETQKDSNFSMPHHCYEYCNTLGWDYDHFEHPLRLKLLYVAASFLNRAASHQRETGDANSPAIRPPAGADRMTAGTLLERVDGAILVTQRVGKPWPGRRAYLDNIGDRAPIVERVAMAACRMGNDPHNQEIAQCMLQDFGKNRSPEKDKLLLAAAYHTAVHRKYGDVQEPSRRFGQAFGIAALS